MSPEDDVGPADPSGESEILDAMARALAIEREAIDHVAARLDRGAARAVELVLQCRGRVVVTGIGKTGLVARKMAATLASTGTPAFFLHPAEALHGDLGVITADDVVVVVSNSGETEEILGLVPFLKRFGVPIVSLTGNPASTLGRHSDAVIDVAVPREADPLGLAPTASTTAAMAMGDALAVTLLQRRNFTHDQFAIFHPGGQLGRKLLWRVGDLMHTGDRVPVVSLGTDVRTAVYEITTKSLGATFVVDVAGLLVGVFTDGDLRRLLQREPHPLDLVIDEVMVRSPRTITADRLAAEAIRRLEDHAITVLPVIDDEGRPIGALHLHDLVRAGLA